MFDCNFDSSEVEMYEKWLRSGKVPRGCAPADCVAAINPPREKPCRLLTARPTKHSCFHAAFENGGTLHLNLCSHPAAGGPEQLTPEMVAGAAAVDDVPLVVGDPRDCSGVPGKVVDVCVSPGIIHVADASPGFLRQLVAMAIEDAAARVDDVWGDHRVTRIDPNTVGGPADMVFEVDAEPAESTEPAPREQAREAPGPRPVAVLRPEGERHADGRPEWMSGWVRLPEGLQADDVDISLQGTKLAVLLRRKVVWRCRLRYAADEDRSEAKLRAAKGGLRLRIATRPFTEAENAEREREDAEHDSEISTRALELRRRLDARRRLLSKQPEQP